MSDWTLTEAEATFRMLPADPYPGGLAECSRLVLDELDRLRRALTSARAVAAQWQAMRHTYSSNEESVRLADLLDGLAETLGAGT